MGEKKLLDFIYKSLHKIEDNISEMMSDTVKNNMSSQQLLLDLSTLLGNCISLRVAIEDRKETIIRDRQKYVNVRN